MKQPLISVALCTYNGEKYIKEQLQSIIDQTYQNIEIIIVDDCSTDKTFLIVNDFAKCDARIRCFRNDTNLGFNKNFEKALKLTKGSFISISDQDDIWEINKIQILLDNIKDNWLIFSNSVIIDENGVVKDEKLLSDFSLSRLRSYKSLLLNNYITGHTTLFARVFLTYILPFPPIGFYDWWMGFIAHYHKRIVFIDQVLTKYRHHESAVTGIFRNSNGIIKNRYFEVMFYQVQALSTYPNFKEEDRIYVNNLNNALRLKLSKAYSMPLFKMIMEDYYNLFPYIKVRKGISKVNFALRFSKREKDIVIKSLKIN
ncbi:glycosyltransferase [Mucilaginibacter sp. NFX135]|uniref:glycosyltransferase n=1 Tax=Mucilaginibacter sp. NFX135 TaxID=3402687 RepID=UPI003AFA1919